MLKPVAEFFLAMLFLWSSRTPVYTEDVAPILQANCVSCHRPGQVAPFSLLSYDDAKKRAQSIAEITLSRAMPPWGPVAPHFAGERRLTDKQIETLAKWAATGAPEGTPAKLAKPIPLPDTWQLGEPDLTVELPADFEVPAEGKDLYRCFVIPVLKVPPGRYIRAMEFRPSNRRVVHHALLFTDTSHIQLPPNYSCFGSIGVLPTNGLGGWSPGNGASRMSVGAAIPLQPGSRLIAQVHYHPSGKPETDRWKVALYLTDKAPTTHVVDVGLTSRQIDIPAGEAKYVVRDHFTLPVDVWAVGIIPHAHYVCRNMQGWAILPSGKKIHLIDIRDWNFNWQDQYRYPEPILLPEDTRLEMEFTYDNSTANPRNPHSPPERVIWGAGVDDEMAGLHIQAIPVRMEDLPELGKALWGKVMRQAGGSFYRLPRQ